MRVIRNCSNSRRHGCASTFCRFRRRREAGRLRKPNAGNVGRIDRDRVLLPRAGPLLCSLRRSACPTSSTPPTTSRRCSRPSASSSIEELFAKIPAAIRLQRAAQRSAGPGEMELTRHVQKLAARNRPADDAVCFLGGGSYDHFIPAVVDAVAGRSEFYTAYTPYQAEASQGSLQAFFEFQTLICQLTGLDVANASLYEGGSAVAEAVLMAMAVTGRHRQGHRRRERAPRISHDATDVSRQPGAAHRVAADARRLSRPRRSEASRR